MNALLELKKQLEIDFLKTKTYEEINDMFNQLNDKLRLVENEVKTLRQNVISEQTKLLLTFADELNAEAGFPLNSEGFEEFVVKFLNK